MIERAFSRSGIELLEVDDCAVQCGWAVVVSPLLLLEVVGCWLVGWVSKIQNAFSWRGDAKRENDVTDGVAKITPTPPQTNSSKVF